MGTLHTLHLSQILRNVRVTEQFSGTGSIRVKYSTHVQGSSFNVFPLNVFQCIIKVSELSIRISIMF